MKNQIRIKPRFYILLCLILTACILLCNRSCNPHAHVSLPPPAMIDSVLAPDQRVIDSLHAELAIRDSTIKKLRAEVHHSSGEVIHYVARYRTATDPATKLNECDSLATAAVELVEHIEVLDSTNQLQTEAYEESLVAYQHAVDTCKSEYNELSGNYTQAIGQIDRSVRGTKKLRTAIVVLATTVITETIIILSR